ncbi:MAG: hypothetical protein MUC45_10635 [Actinomycetia bacterium]|jgi:hypothetical protein|nr:hypothetical protein [Actinomycetes bacterium]
MTHLPALLALLGAEETFTDGTLPAPGWLGFIIIVLLCVATVLLIRSMNTQLRRVPPSFDEPRDGADHSE